MLQYEEKQVRIVQENRLNQEIKHRQPGEVFLVYDGDHYVGYLGWENEAWNRPENIVTEFVEDATDEETIDIILKKKPIIKLPILTKQSRYDKITFVSQVSKLTAFQRVLTTSIESLKQTKSIQLMEQLSIYNGVLLLGEGFLFNKLEELFLAYDLKTSRKKRIERDEKWLVLEEQNLEHNMIIRSILVAADIENINTYIRVKRELNKKGIPVIFIAFPKNSDLILTDDETYRATRLITFDYAKKIQTIGSPRDKMELEKAYQKEIDEGDMKKSAFMVLSQNEENMLYLCGACIVSGNAPQGDRFPEILYQEIMSDFGFGIERLVISEPDSLTGNQLLSSDFKEHDFVIILRHMSKKLRNRFKDHIDIDLTAFFQKRSKNVPWFSDEPMHITGEGSRQLVKYLFPLLKPYLVIQQENAGKRHKQIKKFNLSVWEERNLELYFKRIENECFDQDFSNSRKIGAIVMNCNPFSNGHKYLIEQACKQVDGLYIFVVEEDLSMFPFEDRLMLVKEGIGRDAMNVRVIPSGRFVLSSRTFASYFAKESLQTKRVNASEDITFFGQFIAPRLHIDIRFFGEEPADLVTRQYNEMMKERLPYYGVSVIVIPRKKTRGGRK